MTGEERKQRDAKSAVIVERLVRVQLRATGYGRFDLGIKRDAGEMILREGQGAIEIEEAVKWLRQENGVFCLSPKKDHSKRWLKQKPDRPCENPLWAGSDSVHAFGWL